MNQAGDRVIVGAYYSGNYTRYVSSSNNDKHVAYFRKGAVFVFDFIGASQTWERISDPVLIGENNNDYFGLSVAINGSGDTIAVGATGTDSTFIPRSTEVGMVRLFKYQTVTLEQWETFNRTTQHSRDGTPILVSDGTYDSSKKYWIQLESNDTNGESANQNLGRRLGFAKTSNDLIVGSAEVNKTLVLHNLAVQNTGNVMPTATPYPTPTHTPTPTPTPTTYPWSSGNHSILLDNDMSSGSVSNSQHILIPTFSLPDQSTISVWLYGSNFGTSAYHTIVGYTNANEYITEHNGGILIGDTGQLITINGSSNVIDNDTKTLITITRNWTSPTLNYTVYKNGVLWGTGGVTRNGTPDLTINAIGGFGEATNPSKPAGLRRFKGKIHEFIIFGKELDGTSAEISDLYNGGTPIDASTISNNILLWYRMGNINFDGSTPIKTIEDASIYNRDGRLKVGVNDYLSPGNNTGPEFTNFV